MIRRKTPNSCEECKKRFAPETNLPDCDDPNGMFKDCPRKRKINGLPPDFEYLLTLANLATVMNVPPFRGSIETLDLTFCVLLIELKVIEAFAIRFLGEARGGLRCINEPGWPFKYHFSG